MRNIAPFINLPLLFLVGSLFLLIYLPKRIEKWRLHYRIRAIQKFFSNKIFTIVVSPPFVFVSDEEAGDLNVLIDRTVRWILPKLKTAYFNRNPKANTVIWLLKNRESYECFVRKYGVREHEDSKGYFDSEKNEIVIDSSNCYGTLVHEIIHAFMVCNFPHYPTWFNEGLASLYNTCEEEEGDILGLPDWSLSDIQSAILNQTVLSFEILFSLQKKYFYLLDKKRNYAQAKYLCYYLQQQGLLKDFYQIFKNNRRKDPTGFKTLHKIVGYDDMEEFQKDWEQFILTIPCPTESQW
jgi:hypothetical protein